MIIFNEYVEIKQKIIRFIKCKLYYCHFNLSITLYHADPKNEKNHLH
jgi:hypothetical protein